LQIRFGSIPVNSSAHSISQPIDCSYGLSELSILEAFEDKASV
jgi:hypothetical protein